MYGAILGDIIGSPYEFDMGGKTKDFPLFSPDSEFTDDTVMTIAVGYAFLDAQPNADSEWIRRRLISSMKQYGRMFPYAGYGGMFRRWLKCDAPQPYGSFGNGSAMRVSSAAWLYNDIETVRSMARLSAEVSHNHPEGIKGAEATASAIYLARTGNTKAEIKAYIICGVQKGKVCDGMQVFCITGNREQGQNLLLDSFKFCTFQFDFINCYLHFLQQIIMAGADSFN